MASFFAVIFFGLIRFFASIFKGRTGAVVEALQPLAEKIVGELMDSDLSGPERRTKAEETLKLAAIEAGLKEADHAIGLLIELEVTKAKGDPLEQVLDEGLEAARQVVKSINASDLSGDAERRAAALAKLTADFLAAGKNWLCTTHTLNLLIEAAVSSFKI